MAKIPRNRSWQYSRAVFEMLCMKKHAPTFQVSLSGMTLNSRGTLQTEENGTQYRIQITYMPWEAPKIHVVRPKICFNKEIHMYEDESLCLYDWRQQPWQPQWHIHETIIPWTAEWLVFFELYELSGKWLGKSALHGNPEKVVLSPPALDVASDHKYTKDIH